MPVLERSGVRIHYVERGDPEAFPVLLFAPGGMRSAASFWQAAPWNPLDALQDRYRVIGMDQRNAGSSSAPVQPGDGWHVYTQDQLALLDHLGIERCHALGGCIGGSYALGLIQTAPERVASAVLQQPIGASAENRGAFHQMFDRWRDELAPARPEIRPEAFAGLRRALWDGDFVFSASRDFVRRCPAPLLVLMGNDLYHPEATSREIAALAPRAELVERWKEPAVVGDTVKRVRTFLEAHTPQ